MRLTTWAKKTGVSYKTAWRLFKTGMLSCKQLPTGTIIVLENEGQEQKRERVAVYARVSSSENKSNLDSQADRVCAFCSAKGWIVETIVKECASGMNDQRPKLKALLQDKSITKIVVEHKDRLTRFGFEYIKLLASAEIVVINEAKTDESDLMSDFISIITSFSARLYGRRRSRRNTEKLIKELNETK